MRIPSSLKWLVDKRARLLGEINKVEKTIPLSQIELNKKIAEIELRLVRLKSKLDHLRMQQAQGDNRPLYLEALRSDLVAIDRALEQHDIQIDPKLIKPICSQWADRFLPHGEMTRQIYACLKAAYPEPRTTTEVALFVLSAAEVQLNTNELLNFRSRVSQRLGHLVWQKKISRLHEVKTCEEGRWTLLPLSPPLESHARITPLPAD